MKGNERKIYVVLSSEIDGILCCFCRYSRWTGECFEGCEGYYECEHPIEAVPGYEEELSPGADCWGFKPEIPLQDVADIVGIILAEGFRGWAWWREDGQIRVHGQREAVQS